MTSLTSADRAASWQYAELTGNNRAMQIFADAGTYTPHRFADITEDLALGIVFRPAVRIAGGRLRLETVRNYWPERTMVAASSMPRRASASARSLPGSPA